MDVTAWLRDLGLEPYAEAFRAHDIDAALLPSLTAEDLKDLGVASVGHRRRILDAIAARAPPGAAPRVAPADAAVFEAERRQLTLMFCDLVGSSALAAERDPEDMGAIIRAYQRCVTDVVERFEGYVAKYMGDGILVYFGYPRAHEDLAERAVRAGLAIVEAVGALRPSGDLRLHVRIGIATGPVMVGEVIGEGMARERVVFGEAPNLAARLQALAEPDAVVIGPTTRPLIDGMFDLADLGSHRLRSLAEPVRAWRVLGPSRAEGRFEARQRAGPTPLVGRERKLALLLDRWTRARSGAGQVVLLSGEAGIGKSRLVQALRDRLGDEPHIRLSHYCSPYHVISPLHPLIDHLERAAGFGRDDAPEIKLARLEALLAQASNDVGEAAPLLAALLAIPPGERYPPLKLTPQRQKELTLNVLIAQLVGLAARQPVLVVLEDAHWIDPTTRELFDLTVERVRDLPVLVVITFRPDFQPPWVGQPHVAALALRRLTRRQGAALAAQLANKALPGEVVAQIVARTDGVPLFVEELTKAVLASGLLQEEDDRYILTGPLPPLAIPSTLQDSLMARLDRLAPAKEVAQIGAAIGREFAYELLAAVAPLSEDALHDALDRLVGAGLIFGHGAPPDARYVFKHALVRDAAYESLLKRRRRQLHAAVAEALEERFPDTAEAAPELLAHHCTEAGLADRAVEYWLRAGQRAAARSANVEAVGHLGKGLEVLATLPETLERKRQALTLLVARGPALIFTEGPGTPEVERTYARALELCAQLPESPLHVAAYWGWWRISQDFRIMAERADRFFAVAERLRDPGLLLQGHHCQWATRFNLGDPEGCCQHIERGLRLYGSGDYHAHASAFGGHDAKVCALGEMALALWLLGYPDRARGYADDALDWARRLAHAGSRMHAIDIAVMVHRYRRDVAAVRDQAEVMIALAEEQGFTDHRAKGLVFLGWALAVQGEVEPGLDCIRRGLGAQRRIGTKEDFPIYLDMMAEVLNMAGRAEEGLGRIDEALHEAELTGLRIWRPELHRRRGELLLALDGGRGAAAAAEEFRAALAVAGRQKARSLELRAATSLARLWHDQGKHTEARELLAPVYGWFTEGFDTPDVKDAKDLLDDLGWGGAGLGVPGFAAAQKPFAQPADCP